MCGVSDSRRPAPKRRRSTQGADAFVVTPFMRLARTHIASVIGDTLVTLSLAGSLFFSVEPDAARGNVALYLALTVAPFAIVGPLIGPAIDRARGGRRMMMFGSAVIRSLMAVLMMFHLDSLLLYPEAFTVLVAGKTYHVSKSAIVPTLVRRDVELVEANSKLVLLGGLAGAFVFLPGAGLRWIDDSLPLLVAALVFAAAAALSLKLPSTAVMTAPPSQRARSELRSAGIVLAASAMALLRAMVGFLTFLLVFWLRTNDAHLAWFGLIGLSAVIGSLGGAVSAPFVRRVLREEMILATVLIASAAISFVAASSPSRALAMIVALVVGSSTSLGKLSFDAIVQRDAPDANQGASFAKFETRFQLAWVMAALIPVVGSTLLPIRVGFLILAIGASLGAFFYLGGLRAVARGAATPGDRLKRRVLADARAASKRIRSRREQAASTDGVRVDAARSVDDGDTAPGDAGRSVRGADGVDEAAPTDDQVRTDVEISADGEMASDRPAEPTTKIDSVAAVTGGVASDDPTDDDTADSGDPA